MRCEKKEEALASFVVVRQVRKVRKESIWGLHNEQIPR